MPYQPNRLDRYQVMMNNLDGMVAWDSIARISDIRYAGSFNTEIK